MISDVNNFSFSKLISIAYFSIDLIFFFIQSYLPFMVLNDDFVDIGKSYGTCSPTFVSDAFLGFFLHPSIFSFKHSRPA